MTVQKSAICRMRLSKAMQNPSTFFQTQIIPTGIRDPSAVHGQANAVYEAVFLRQKGNGGDVDNITLPSLPRPAVCDPKIFLTDPVIFPICA
jgi:hypothetical protein